MNRTKHSFLHDIRIAKPCTADWEKMTGDERSRFCHQCKLNVYNISAMTIEEAEQLILKKEERLCLRMYRRKDGTLLMQDCPVGVKKAIRQVATIYGGIAGVFMIILAYCGWKTPEQRSLEQQTIEAYMHRTVMGEWASTEPTMGKVPYMTLGIPATINLTDKHEVKGRVSLCKPAPERRRH